MDIEIRMSCVDISLRDEVVERITCQQFSSSSSGKFLHTLFLTDFKSKDLAFPFKTLVEIRRW